MAKLFASAVFCSSGLWLDEGRLRTIASDARTPAWATHVERAYRSALSTLFNDYYRRSIEVRHVLSARLRTPGLGTEVWSDWVLLRNRRLRTTSLHLAFTFPTLQLDLEDPQCPVIETATAFLAQVYQLSEAQSYLSPGLAELSRVLTQRSRKRQHALGVSRYMYVSLLTDDRRHVDEPSASARINFYRLLYQHACGVDEATAVNRLPAPWRSTSFFQLYTQPGGMLSIATGYPQGRAAEGWFDPLPPEVGLAPNQPLTHALLASPAASERDYEDYDLLPEYPPLRYLGLLSVEYAAAHEETLRVVFESAFGRGGPWLRAPFRPRPEVLHLLAANLEGIRLPVMRGLVHSMLEVQLQERTVHGAMESLRLREGKRTILLTILSILVALVFADHQKAFDGLKAVVSSRAQVQVPAASVPTAAVR